MQVVPDTKLSEASDLAAKRQNDLEMEQQDRRGYLACPQWADEFRALEDAAAWPAR